MINLNWLLKILILYITQNIFAIIFINKYILGRINFIFSFTYFSSFLRIIIIYNTLNI